MGTSLEGTKQFSTYTQGDIANGSYYLPLTGFWISTLAAQPGLVVAPLILPPDHAEMSEDLRRASDMRRRFMSQCSGIRQ
jgi:hypothetical protein